MGLFSGIKKAVKKVFKGIKKVFKKVGKFIGKIAGSKWGKVLLAAAAVFTGGMALAAGFSGFAGTTGTFLTKFVAGSKAFIGALANPIGQAKEMFGSAAQAATTGQKVAAGTEALGSAAEGILASGEGAAAVANTGEAILSGSGAMEGAQLGGMQGLGGGAAKAAAQTTAELAAKKGTEEVVKQSLLQKAGGAAMNFAKSTGGGQILSGAIEGYAGGRGAEEQLKAEMRERRYYDKAWQGGAGLDKLKAATAGDVAVPGGYLRRAMNTGEQVTNFTPRVKLKEAGAT